MKTKNILWSLLGIILIIGAAFIGVIAFQNRQDQIKAEEAAAEQKQAEAEQQRIEEEKIAQEKAAQEALRNQLITGNYDPNTKVVFLTFDDGPDDSSNEVLDILSRTGVKATFFTNGRVGPEYEEVYRRIVNDGHVLANHSYSHDYDLYNSPQAFLDDVKRQEDYIRSITGVEPVKVFRFPGGSTMTDISLINQLTSMGYNYYDWTSSAGDGASEILPAQGVLSKILTEVYERPVSVILCHGENPAKTTTREALEPLINQLKSEGYTFMTLDPAYPLTDAKFMAAS